jgi:hypothetical protein
MVIFPAASLEESSLTRKNARPLKPPAPEPIPGCRVITDRLTTQSTGLSRTLNYPPGIIAGFLVNFL